VSDPLDWNAAQREWNLLDEQHRSGLLPQARFFEVRSVTLGPDRPLVGPEVRSHDRYDRAPLNQMMARVVVKGSRGFKKAEDAARAAWRIFAPEFTDRGYHARYLRRFREARGHAVEARKSTEQGRGGWFYYPNGTTAAQGLHDLARVCKARNLIAQGVNGKWYVVEIREEA
jgi:hypothetical protein